MGGCEPALFDDHATARLGQRELGRWHVDGTRLHRFVLPAEPPRLPYPLEWQLGGHVLIEGRLPGGCGTGGQRCRAGAERAGCGEGLEGGLMAEGGGGGGVGGGEADLRDCTEMA